MVKRLIQLISFLLLIILSFLIYLSIYGISTNKFNNLISEKISERNENLNINLNKIKIFLNISNFNFELKTKEPKVFLKNKEIKIESISTDLPLKNFFSTKFNLEKIKIKTDKNQIKNLISVARTYRNNPQLFILNKIVKDGTVSLESKINFNEDGSIKNSYIIDGNVENLKIELANENLIEDINFNFLIKDKEYLIYNLSSIYQSINIRSNQIKISNNQNNFKFEGDISNKKGKINFDKFSNFLNDDLKGIFKNNLIFNSNNKFSFKISKRIKLLDIKIQSKLSLESIKYSNNIFKRFFPGYKKDIKIQDNSITFDYENGDYEY